MLVKREGTNKVNSPNSANRGRSCDLESRRLRCGPAGGRCLQWSDSPHSSLDAHFYHSWWRVGDANDPFSSSLATLRRLHLKARRGRLIIIKKEGGSNNNSIKNSHLMKFGAERRQNNVRIVRGTDEFFGISPWPEINILIKV